MGVTTWDAALALFHASACLAILIIGWRRGLITRLLGPYAFVSASLVASAARWFVITQIGYLTSSYYQTYHLTWVAFAVVQFLVLVWFLNATRSNPFDRSDLAILVFCFAALLLHLFEMRNVEFYTTTLLILYHLQFYLIIIIYRHWRASEEANLGKSLRSAMAFLSVQTIVYYCAVSARVFGYISAIGILEASQWISFLSWFLLIRGMLVAPELPDTSARVPSSEWRPESYSFVERMNRIAWRGLLLGVLKKR